MDTTKDEYKVSVLPMNRDGSGPRKIMICLGSKIFHLTVDNPRFARFFDEDIHQGYEVANPELHQIEDLLKRLLNGD